MIRKAVKMTQKEFSEYIRIPVADIRNWEQGCRKPPEYVMGMMERIMIMDGLLVDTSQTYISSDLHIPFTMKMKENGQYTASFSYKNTDYTIDAPFYSYKSKAIQSLIIGTGFLVDDKVEDIDFLEKAGIEL